jgi:serine/threonine-protein kinase HipA
MNSSKEILVYADSAHDNSQDLNLASEVAHFFRLTGVQAEAIIQTTVGTVSQWQKTAQKYRISREEQDRMKSAFINN